MDNSLERQFQQVRDSIDQVDSQLVELIAKRLELTSTVGELKAELNLPLYVPEREAELICKRRAQAFDANLSPELIEDVLRRIMRDSYANQSQTRAEATVSQHKSIVIVGGEGQLGQLFCRLFSSAGYSVQSIDKHDWGNKSGYLLNADLVMVAVPIRKTVDVIRQLPKLKSDCLLVDITSVKSEPLDTMLTVHSGPVIGLHPMFGPGIQHLAKQTVALCEGRGLEQSQWFVDQLINWGVNLTRVDAKEHDQLMAIIQVLRHFSTIAYGYHLQQENTNLEKVLDLSSPIYRLELIMVGRLFAQNADLYSDIIFSDKSNIPMVKRFIERLSEVMALLESQDKLAFTQLFDNVAEWFGEKSGQFLSESNQLLAKANDIKK